jgi:hypothetical protein
MTVRTRLVEVPERTAAEQERAEALLRAENQVLVAADEWFLSWAGRADDVAPGLDRRLYDAIEGLEAARARR